LKNSRSHHTALGREASLRSPPEGVAGPAINARRYLKTQIARELSVNLRALGWEMVPGIANFCFCQLPRDALMPPL